MIKEKTHDAHLDALNATIATLRNEIALLAADLKILTEWRNTHFSTADETTHEHPSESDARSTQWTRFQSHLNHASKRGKKIAHGIAKEIERHPLIGGLATFGIGFALAKLLFKQNKLESAKKSG